MIKLFGSWIVGVILLVFGAAIIKDMTVTQLFDYMFWQMIGFIFVLLLFSIGLDLRRRKKQSETKS